jgi:hypothetical protein
VFGFLFVGQLVRLPGVQYPDTSDYRLRFAVFEASELPFNDKDVSNFISHIFLQERCQSSFPCACVCVCRSSVVKCVCVCVCVFV